MKKSLRCKRCSIELCDWCDDHERRVCTFCMDPEHRELWRARVRQLAALGETSIAESPGDIYLVDTRF